MMTKHQTKPSVAESHRADLQHVPPAGHSFTSIFIFSLNSCGFIQSEKCRQNITLTLKTRSAARCSNINHCSLLDPPPSAVIILNTNISDSNCRCFTASEELWAAQRTRWQHTTSLFSLSHYAALSESNWICKYISHRRAAAPHAWHYLSVDTNYKCLPLDTESSITSSSNHWSHVSIYMCAPCKHICCIHMQRRTFLISTFHWWRDNSLQRIYSVA